MMLGTVEGVVMWLVNDVPTRMVCDGRRWRVTDRPTRWSEPVWALPLDPPRHMSGWRFQATDDAGATAVFDVSRAEGGWVVLRSWA